MICVNVDGSKLTDESCREYINKSLDHAQTFLRAIREKEWTCDLVQLNETFANTGLAVATYMTHCETLSQFKKSKYKVEVKVMIEKLEEINALLLSKVGFRLHTLPDMIRDMCAEENSLYNSIATMTTKLIEYLGKDTGTADKDPQLDGIFKGHVSYLKFAEIFTQKRDNLFDQFMKLTSSSQIELKYLWLMAMGELNQSVVQEIFRCYVENRRSNEQKSVIQEWIKVTTAIHESYEKALNKWEGPLSYLIREEVKLTISKDSSLVTKLGYYLHKIVSTNIVSHDLLMFVYRTRSAQVSTYIPPSEQLLHLYICPAHEDIEVHIFGVSTNTPKSQHKENFLTNLDIAPGKTKYKDPKVLMDYLVKKYPNNVIYIVQGTKSTSIFGKRERYMVADLETPAVFSFKAWGFMFG
jgi:hypothetical protein